MRRCDFISLAGELERPDALFVSSGTLFNGRRVQLTQWAAHHDENKSSPPSTQNKIRHFVITVTPGADSSGYILPSSHTRRKAHA
jgi:hypothetical protein